MAVPLPKRKFASRQAAVQALAPLVLESVPAKPSSNGAAKVPIALGLLILLLVAAPVLLVCDGPLLSCAVGGLAGGVLLAAALGLRPREGAHVWRSIRMLASLTLVPVVWMAIQMLPNPFLAHPIWRSAASALDLPLAGRISADPALTLLALFQFLAAMAIMLAAAAIAVERQRAQVLMR